MGPVLMVLVLLPAWASCQISKLRVAHAPKMSRTFSPAPLVSYPDMHHGTCVTHVPWCMLGSLTSSFLWTRWQENRSRLSRRMRNPQLCVSGKRPMPTCIGGGDDQESVWGMCVDILSDIQLLVDVFGLYKQRHSVQFAWWVPSWSLPLRESCSHRDAENYNARSSFDVIDFYRCPQCPKYNYRSHEDGAWLLGWHTASG